MQYLKFRSLTFWAGVLSILAGALIGVHEVRPLGWAVDALVNVLGPASSPSMLVTQGLGLIGLRRAVAP